MKRDLVLTKPITSSFLSCEKDTETILKKLFIESRPYSDILKRLLLIPNKDALDNTTNEQYNKKLQEMSLAKMIEEGYVLLKPIQRMDQFENLKSFISLSFGNFTPNGTNPEFRDCIIYIDVMCHHDIWDLGDYRLRPFKIMGYIDGLLNDCRLSGIGTLNFAGSNETTIDENWTFYTLMYTATHGSDDQIASE